MSFAKWLGLARPKPSLRTERPLRVGQTVTFDVTQCGNRVDVTADGVDIHFIVDGVDLPAEADASFAVWAVLALAMEQGFDVRINRPIDPLISANAEELS